MDITFKSLDEDFETYGKLTINEGKIKFSVSTKKNVKAFIQWTRDEIRCGRNPALLPFPVASMADLLRRYATHQNFLERFKDLTEASRPKKLKSGSIWNDWKPMFINFLRMLPGRDRVPLSYVICKNDLPDNLPNIDFLEEYVNQAPLNGETFKQDSKDVRLYIIKYIAGNDDAEAKVQSISDDKCRRKVFKALEDIYKGTGINAKDIRKADRTIKEMHYTGEKKPYIWWDEFEKQLRWAFSAYDKREGRVVYSEEMKLRVLNDKIKADFLTATKISLKVEMNKMSMTLTFDMALKSYRDVSNEANPASSIHQSRSQRRGACSVNQMDSWGGRGRQSF